jgi:superfamily I DNA/RNA helicase/RecB family exonuclease
MSAPRTSISDVPPVTPLEPDDEQLKVFQHERGSMIVTGSPGTGKTATLRERFALLVGSGVDPEKIALFTLTRRARRDALDHLMERIVGPLPDLPVFTIHGYAYGLIADRRFRDLGLSEPPQVLSAPEQYAVVRDLLSAETAREWPTLAPTVGKPSFTRQVADFVLRCQERLLEPDSVGSLARRSGRDDYVETAGFYGRYLDALEAAGQIDFGGLLARSAALLSGSASVPPGESFEHLLVDDFQDSTPAAEAILLALARQARSLVIAAQPGGHIFSYQGYTQAPLERAMAGETFAPSARVSLATPHRGGHETASLLRGLEDPDAKPPGPVESRAGAEARLANHPGQEADAVAAELLRLRVDEDVPWERMAVVVRRYRSHLTTLRHALARNGIPFSVVSEEADLANEPAVRPLINLFSYAWRPNTRDALLEPLLASSIVGLGPYDLRDIRRAARTAGTTVLEIAEGSAPAAATRRLSARVVEALASFRSLVADLVRLAEERSLDGMLFELWANRLPYARELVARAEAGDAKAIRALDAIAAFADSLRRSVERRPGATMEDFLEGLEAAGFAADPWIPPEERRPSSVRVISAHRAQGMEFDAVLIAGCLEGEFPTPGLADAMLSIEQLTDPLSPSQRIARRAAEERALFLMAASRARHHTILFASASASERTPRTPSRFAARMGLAWTPIGPTRGAATSLQGMEIQLRTRLADASADPADRLAAAAALPATEADPMAWWGAVEWSQNPVPMHPEEQMRTSYSRLNSLQACSLRYLYESELGLSPTRTHQMWMGSLIHDIIDRVQREELPATREAMVAELDAGWRRDEFAEPAVEHQRYRDAIEMIDNWLAEDASGTKGRLLMSERSFDFPFDSALIRGKIDAAYEGADDRTVIRDYKTGRSPITQKEAEADLQLGVYFLAAKESDALAELSARGDPGVLELAYLAKTQKRAPYKVLRVFPEDVDDYETEMRETLTRLIAAVRAEEFAPNPAADCRYCGFQSICPRWPEGGEPPVDGARGVR